MAVDYSLYSESDQRAYSAYVRSAGDDLPLPIDEWMKQTGRNIPVAPPDPTKPGTVGNDGVYKPLSIGGKASDMFADVTRSVYQDWKDNYLPIALQMMGQTTYNNPELVNQNVTQAVGNINSSFANSQGQQERAFQRYGVGQTEAQKTTSDRMSNLSKSAAIADAANRIRQNLADRNRQVALGGIPNLAGKAYGGNE